MDSIKPEPTSAMELVKGTKGSNFAEILKELREKAGFESQTKFAEACGVDNSTIARLERGETKPSPKTLNKLAPILGVSLMKLMIAADYVKADSNITKITSEGLNALGYKEINLKDFKSKFMSVPVFKKINAGYSSLDEREVIGHRTIARECVPEGEYFYLNITGDTMVDAEIKEGSRVLVRYQNFVEQGKIAVVIINGEEGTLYRVYHQDSQVILQSENSKKKYPPRILNTEDALIQGQVYRVEIDV